MYGCLHLSYLQTAGPNPKTEGARVRAQGKRTLDSLLLLHPTMSAVPASPTQSGSGSNKHRGNLLPHSLPRTATRRTNWFVRSFRAVFGYRKTSLTLLVALVLAASVALSVVDNLLQYSVSMPVDPLEQHILHQLWESLQVVASTEHTYTSSGNDKIHDYLEEQIARYVAKKSYADYDNDANATAHLMFAVKYLLYDSVLYYESNNLVVRINGSNASLPALLVSAHYDSVPTAQGVTDDGMGVASMLGLLAYYTSKEVAQPERTLIFNFNNNEEFGLYGATAFLRHPWFHEIGYFLNLEGTGAGGKAILFRGTDVGIVRHFGAVRFPYAASLFQEGFNNRLIHSETDYSVYIQAGLRGLDLAFYKPRDVYHTTGDNIRNVNQKSLWHMLSSSLDFVNHMVSQQIDLDDEYFSGAATSNELALYTSFMNYFFAFSVSQVVSANIFLLVVAPVISLLLLFVIFRCRKGWHFNFVNSIKFPVSFVSSVLILSFATDVVVVPSNPFVANSSVGFLVATLFSLFLLLNYAILNGFNIILKPFKGHLHDEKLIVIIQSSFLTWVVLLWSTVKLSHNKHGDDHTGELFIPLLFTLQATACLFGLLGWTLKPSKKISLSANDSRPLLSADAQDYGSNDDGSLIPSVSSSSLDSESSEECKSHETKSFSYDWLVQFLVTVPLSSFLIYNSGSLVLSGVSKSIQESLASQDFIYKVIQLFVVVWAVPFLPFIFKVNRIFILALVLVLLYGALILNTTEPFDNANPLKLRFMEKISLNSVPPTNIVNVNARLIDLVKNVLEDMPSLKQSKEKLSIEPLGDGMLKFSYVSPLTPHLVPGVENFTDYLSIDVLKDSSTVTDSPFGFLSGELKIKVPKNRNCKINFNMTDTVIKLSDASFKDTKRSPVRTFVVYKDKNYGNKTTSYIGTGVPEGYSEDSHGNSIFKDSDGISQVQLNKLDWDKPYHIGFQWVPEIVESESTWVEKISTKKLGVNIECFWGDLGDVAEKDEFGNPVVEKRVPAFEELLHYSPSYVSWANGDRGMVSVSKYIEV